MRATKEIRDHLMSIREILQEMWGGNYTRQPHAYKHVRLALNALYGLTEEYPELDTRGPVPLGVRYEFIPRHLDDDEMRLLEGVIHDMENGTATTEYMLNKLRLLRAWVTCRTGKADDPKGEILEDIKYELSSLLSFMQDAPIDRFGRDYHVDRIGKLLERMRE